MEQQKRKVVPPVYFVLTMLLMAALDRALPIMRIFSFTWARIGLVPIALGTFFCVYAYYGFARAGTPVVPFARATALVTTGLYRFTRNPMYLGLVLILAGVATMLGTLSPWLPLPLFLWIIQRRFVHCEERFLEELFGQQYLTYKRRVRRWL
jgi:protein-S-isoprenylcysteine O-methyltransferase Ste14